MTDEQLMAEMAEIPALEESVSRLKEVGAVRTAAALEGWIASLRALYAERLDDVGRPC